MIVNLTFVPRGPSFRREYTNISQIRSIIKKEVNVMALTATAASQTKKIVKDNLEMMDSCTIIERFPNRVNIKYRVC